MFWAQVVLLILLAVSILRTCCCMGQTRQDTTNGVDVFCWALTASLLFYAGAFDKIFHIGIGP